MRRLLPVLLALATACHGDRATGPDAGAEVGLANGIVASAAAFIEIGDVEPPTLVVRTVIRNAGATTGTVSLAATCTVEIRAYRVGGSKSPVYDESNQVCTLPARTLTLAPGVADTLVRWIDLRVLEAGQNAGRRYRVDALLSADHDPHSGPGRVVLPAGTVTIP